MVGSRKANGIDVLAVEDLAVIDVLGDFAAEEFPCSLREHVPVHIAQGDDAHARHLAEQFDVVAALAVQPDDGDADLVVGSGRAESWKPQSRTRRPMPRPADPPEP